MWLKWIGYTYCMETSLDVALLVVYRCRGGTLKILLEAHLYSAAQTSLSLNVCFENLMTFTVDSCQVQTHSVISTLL